MTVSGLRNYLEILEKEGRGSDNLRFSCSENEKSIDGVYIYGSYRSITNERYETVLLTVSEEDEIINGLQSYI